MASPPVRTLFVARDLTTARDQLDARALAGEDMLGWEPATLRTIAATLAAAPLADERRDACDDIALVECTGAALDGAIAARAIAPSWRAHAARLGFRDALHGALMELRGAGVGVAMLHELPEHAIAALLAATLARYEATLAERGLADPAHVTATALAAFDDEAPFALGDARIVVQGGLRADGLAGALLDRLLAFGAAREPHDTGGDAPHDATRARDWTLRCAATPDDEVRAVLRDALARGLRWDAIELAVSDVGTWSVAAHAVCTTLGVPLTIAPGLPLRRARIGRAFARWLGFVREGLEARALWTALLEGDACLDPATHAVTPVQLAHDLRDLGVGWGRERWDAARARLADGSWRDACLAPRDDGQPAMTAEEGTARADALAHFLHAVLDRMPMLPRRGALDDVPTSAAAFATAALDWLTLVAHATPGDEGPVLERVRARLQRIAERDHDLRPGALALAVVEQALDDVRWWPVWRAQGEIVVPPSRRAEPGALHLVELRDAGTSGRPHVRLLGLDARRCGGGAMREPLLGDSLREAINAVAGATLLPLAEARLRERRARIDWALARLGGRDVALSWCAPDGDAAADACVLDALRARDGMRDADAAVLRAHVGEAHGPVPIVREGVHPTCLDGRDAWLHAMHGDATWRELRPALHAAFPVLARAARHAAALVAAPGSESDDDLAALGLIADFGADGHAPFAGRGISPSELEALGSCPSRWFYRHVLRTRPPDDVAHDPFAWLDGARQGAVLHTVFEHFGREVIAGTRSVHDVDAATVLDAMLDETLAHEARIRPPPSEWLRDEQRAALTATLRGWLRAERAAPPGARWRDVELAIDDVPVTIAGTTLRVRGRADRVDVLPDGTLCVIDYKSGVRGAPYHFGSEGGAFRGGRLVQPSLYALAIAAREGVPSVQFEYRFAGALPPYDVRRYGRDELQAARTTLLPALLAQVATGSFLPTDDTGDCRACDMRVVCRTRDVEFGVESPRAAWTAARMEGSLVQLAPLRARRAGTELAP